MSTIRTQSVESAVHLQYHYVTEDLLTIWFDLKVYSNNPNPKKRLTVYRLSAYPYNQY